MNWQIEIRTVGGDRFIAEPRRSCGPMLLCRRMGSPPLGVPPGELAHEDAMRIFGVINVLSDRRRLGNAFATRKKLLSGDEGEPKNQPLRTPEPEQRTISVKYGNDLMRFSGSLCSLLNSFHKLLAECVVCTVHCARQYPLEVLAYYFVLSEL